jgi:hypothetical protein
MLSYCRCIFTIGNLILNNENKTGVADVYEKLFGRLVESQEKVISRIFSNIKMYYKFHITPYQ